MTSSAQSAARSEGQAEASRLNGARSGGPKSEEGKARSGRNAVKHGLCSGTLSFDNPEAEAEFKSILNGLSEVYIPSNDAEAACIEAMAVAQWRERVAVQMEIKLLEAVDDRRACAMAGGDGLPSLNTILRYKGRIERDYTRARAELEDLRTHRLPAVAPALAGPPSTAMGRDQPAVESRPSEPGLPANGHGTNEPDMALGNGLNREQRRRLEAIRRKR